LNGHISKYKQLSDHVLKLLQTDLKDVILIIIDEMSMIYNLILMCIYIYGYLKY